jgi:hypothetical protein
MLKKALITCTVGLFAVAGVSQASVIDCAVSMASNTNSGVDNICPAGDGDVISISITALDAFSNPIVGMAADSICIECPGVTPKICADNPTDGAGQTTITYSAGGITPDGWCELLPIRMHAGANSCDLAVSGRANPSIRFFDLNAGGLVGPVDFGVFGLCWLQSTVACQKANFDKDVTVPTVGPVDFGVFGLHWLDGAGT